MIDPCGAKILLRQTTKNNLKYSHAVDVIIKATNHARFEDKEKTKVESGSILMSTDRVEKVRPRRLINWIVVLFLLLVPFLATGAAYMITFIQRQVRYNPEYFSEEYVAQYQVLNPFLSDLETALQDGDEGLMAVLQGTRSTPGSLQPNPNIRYSFLLDRQGGYDNHIFWDIETYGRYVQHIKKVDGRFVVVPESLYYYVDSGIWPTVFTPPALYWWSFVIIITIGLWIYRFLAAVRRELFAR